MRKMMLLAAMVAIAALMLAAAPAMANDRNNDNDRNNNHHNRFFFDDDFDQDAESGDVDQTFVVTNTGDNPNQCVGLQGVANTGNAQNQIGLTQLGDGFGDFDRDHRDRFFRDFDFDGDFEFEDVGSSIEVSPTNVTTCDQQVNQAAAASSW